MDIEEVKTLIRLGFEPARYFKRSAWVKVERVMEFLVNEGDVTRMNGEVKYGCPVPPNEEDISRWARRYIRSPFGKHIERLTELSRETRLPLNSKELLDEFFKTM